MSKFLAQGKLPSTVLQRLIAGLPKHDSSVIIPPGIGLDAAGIKIGNKLIAITTDPITFTADAIGTYSIAININDIACLGCKPRWFTATLLLPLGTTENELTKIWKNLSAELKLYNIQPIGGHVEITPTVNIPIIVGQMLGEVLGNNFLDMRQGKAQDKILLWRSIALEGTSLLAKTLQNKLKKEFTKKQLQKLQNIIHDPGICIWPLVKKIVPTKGLIGIHDPTEGGLATALHEIADVCKCGLEIDHTTISIMPETNKLAEIFNFDPLGLIASGCALIVCRPNTAQTIVNKIGDKSIAVIGRLTSSPTKRILIKNGKKTTLPRHTTDEIIHALNSLKN